MARKKAEPTPEEAVAPEPTYEEIHNASVSDILSGEEPPKDEPKEDEPGKEEHHEEQKEVEFDPEKFKQEISEEVSKKIIEATTHREEPRKESDDELISPWAKEDRAPKSYEEVADWALEKKSILDARRAKEDAVKAEETKRAAEAENTRRIDEFNKYTDSQLEDLYAAGRLDKADQDARKALFQTMLDVNVARQKEGKAPIYSIKEIFYEHYKAPEKKSEPAGADAPVSPGKAGTPMADEKTVNYRDIHNKSLIDILMGR